MIVNFVFLSKIKKAYISKPFLVTLFLCMLLSSHTFSFIAYSLRHGHRFKDNSIPPLPYPKALARF